MPSPSQKLMMTSFNGALLISHILLYRNFEVIGHVVLAKAKSRVAFVSSSASEALFEDEGSFRIY